MDLEKATSELLAERSARLKAEVEQTDRNYAKAQEISTDIITYAAQHDIPIKSARISHGAEVMIERGEKKLQITVLNDATYRVQLGSRDASILDDNDMQRIVADWLTR